MQEVKRPRPPTSIWVSVTTVENGTSYQTFLRIKPLWKLHQVTNSSPILWLFLNCQSLEIAGNMHGCLKMVNPEGFRHSGFLNAWAEADVRCCSCLKHLHSEVQTAVHNGKCVYFVCACSLADNTLCMRMHEEYVMPDRDSLHSWNDTFPSETFPSQPGLTIVLKRLGI